MAEEEQTRLGQPESYAPPSSGQTNSKHSRVTSTVAQSFADDLDSMFGLSGGRSGGRGGGVDTLSQTVEEK